MECPRCRQVSPPRARFCIGCGGPLPHRCGRCGTELPAEARFCFSCGQQATAAHPEPRFISPDAYTPRHLGERIINSRAALEGERKLVTILFADLKGSMELMADRDPEEARKILDPVLELMMEAVHRYEGTVNQVLGDGIMALFGAPIAHEDHGLRACYAALRMQEATKRYADEIRRSEGIPLQIRVGLNSGEVVVRSIGSDLHMDYTAIGETTHLAARVEQAAFPGSIVITSPTLRLAEGRVTIRALGPVPLKGRSEPVELYELTGAGPAGTRFQASIAHGLTRFVGREAELVQLHKAIENAHTGNGQIVAVIGEPGVGKSRLVWELVHSARTQGWSVFEGHSVSYGTNNPYLPVIQLLRTYFGIEDRDAPQEIRKKLIGTVLTLDRALEPILQPLLALLDVLNDDDDWHAYEPSRRRQLILEAIKRLLLRESDVRPLLLVLEDLHWIDGETQALLEVLVDSLPSARIALLVNYRPEYEHPWGNRSYYHQLRLETLPPSSSRLLLDGLLGDDVSLHSLKRMLIERTDGNPFFLEESIRTLAETEALQGERGAYRLIKAPKPTELPVNIQAMLAARIDRLPLDEKRLLQCASVVGKDISHSILSVVAQEPEEDLRRQLDHLKTAEFIYETSLFPDLEYTFKHAVTHEVAYGSLVQDTRRTFHARIVDAVEQLHSGRLAEYVERLAHHSLSAESWEKALTYLRQAGAKAFARASHREAATYFERALTALKHLQKTPERTEEAIDVLFDLQLSLLPLGELVKGLDYLREAELLAEPLKNPSLSARGYIYMTGQLYLLGDLKGALEVGHRALSIAESLNDFRLKVSTNAYLGQVHHAQGDYRRAADFFRRNARSLVGELVNDRFGLPQLPSVHSRTCLVWSLAELGEFAEGLEHGKEAIRIAESSDQPFSLTVAYSGLGRLFLCKGALPAAIAMLERALSLSQSGNVPLWFPRIASDLGLAYGLAGQIEKASPLVDQAAQLAASMRLMVSQSLLMASIGEVRLLEGRFEEATDVSHRALALSVQYQERGHQARILKVLGDLSLALGSSDSKQTETYYNDALELAKRLGMRPVIAHSHLGLGRLYTRAAEHVSARENLRIAARLFRDLDMPFWSAQTETLLLPSC